MGKLFVRHYPYNQPSPAMLVEADRDRHGEQVMAVEEAALAFQKMKASAAADDIHIFAISAYRSIAVQKRLFDFANVRHGRRKGILWVAPPGHSEHHTGYAFDIGDWDAPESDDEETFENTHAFMWLKRNAESFGFAISFPRDNPQGVGYEPWHWRYVGSDTAHKIFEHSFTSGLNSFFTSVKYMLLPMETI